MATIVKIFTGEYDLKHQAALHAEFDALHVEDSLVLDMSAVTYLDSTFIGELIWLHELRAYGRRQSSRRFLRCSMSSRSLAWSPRSMKLWHRTVRGSSFIALVAATTRRRSGLYQY
jgi:hypothetical protein